MRKDELTQIIEILKEYDLINTFESVQDTEIWLLGLNWIKIKNLKKLHNREEILNSPLRSILINNNLLQSDYYMEIIQTFLKFGNIENINEKLLYFCSYISGINHFDYLLIEDLSLISKMHNVDIGIKLLKDKEFYQSRYYNEDLSLITSSDELHEEYLCKVARSSDSIRSSYHEIDMQKVNEADKLHVAAVSSLAIDEDSLASSTHEEDMDLLNNCNIAVRKSLLSIMIKEDALKNPNYKLMRDSIMNSNSKERAYAKFCIAVSNLNFNIGLERLKYLINSVDTMPDSILNFYTELLMNEDFIKGPYINFDIGVLEYLGKRKDIDPYDIYSLLNNKKFLNSPRHVPDIQLILDEKEKKKFELLIKLAENSENLASDNHLFDMDYVRRLEIDTLDKEGINMLYFYLLDYAGIHSDNHINMLQKLSNNKGIEEPSTQMILKYFEELENSVSNLSDKDEVEILIKK